MAFDLNFLGRISSTGNENANVVWSYINTDDAEATIRADGYFNGAMGDLTNGVGRLSINDIIYSQGTEGHHMLRITAVVGNVTTDGYLDRSGELGSWTTKQVNTDYVTATDIFVTAQVELRPPYPDDASGIIAETPIGTIRAKTYAIVRPGDVFNISNATITFPVRKGDSWTVTTVVTSGTPLFIVRSIPLVIV